MPIVRDRCSIPGCLRPRVAGGRRRCAAHRRTTSERGYGDSHQARRAQLEQSLPAPCAYGCGRIVTRATFVACHVVDGDPSAGLVAGCRSCNERAKGGALRPVSGVVIV